MSVAIDRDQAFLAAIRRIADEVAAPNADDVDRQARFPVEAIAALREERALSALDPRGVRRRRRLVRGDRGRVLRARPPLRRDRHGLRDAPDPDRLRRAPPRRGAVVRGLASGRRERAATRRVGHVRGRDRRRPRPIDRGGHAGGDGRATLREAGPDRLVRRVCRRPAHDAAPDARRRARRPGRGAHQQGPGHARADRHVGPARDARHLLARLHRPRRVRRRPGPPDALPDRRDRIDGAGLAHPLVAHLAGHRHRRVRPRPRLRPGLGEAATRTRCPRPRCASRTS